MGVNSSHYVIGGTENADPRGIYLEAMNSIVMGGDEASASGLFFGGAPNQKEALIDLKNYRSSRAAEVKDKLVKGVIKAMNTLGRKADTIEDVVKGLPNPQERSFPEDAKTQVEVCKAIAKAINESIGHVIDLEDPPQIICRRVHDLVDSFAHGMQWEFIHVYENVEKTLKDLKVVFDIMNASYESFLEHVKSSDMEFDTEAFKESYNRAKREMEGKIQVLSGLLHTDILPAKEELEIAMKYHNADSQLLKKMKMEPGTSDFSDSLSYAISRSGHLGAMTKKLDKALKTIGMKMEDFMELKSMKELDRKIENLQEKLIEDNKGKRNKLVFNKFHEAVEDLKKYFGKLKTMKTGSAERKFESDKRSEKILKSIAVGKRARILFIRQFAKGLYERYDSVLRSISVMGPKIGKDIPTGPKMEDLVDAFRRLAVRNLRAKDMDRALLGMIDDVRGRELRDSFLSSLRLISRKADDCMKAKDYGNASSYFMSLKSAIDEIIKYIEKYNELRKQKYGADETHSDSDSDSDHESHAEGGDETSDKYGQYKSNIDDYTPKEAFKLEEAIGKFIYFYYVAGVRDNLKSTVSELKDYSTNYESMMSEAIGTKRKVLEEERKVTLFNAEVIYEVEKLYVDDADKAQLEDSYDALVDFTNDVYDAKVNLYKAVEALDLYLKDYTKAVNTNPDIIKDLKKVLESNNNIFNWFNEESGEALANAFDSVPATDKNESQMKTQREALITELGTLYSDFYKDRPRHYYQKFETKAKEGLEARKASAETAEAKLIDVEATAAAAGVTLGLDTTGDVVNGVIYLADNITIAREKIDQVLNNFQALQNIMNSFIMVANISGDSSAKKSDLRTIYKSFVDYIIVSAFTYSKPSHFIHTKTASADELASIQAKIKERIESDSLLSKNTELAKYKEKVEDTTEKNEIGLQFSSLDEKWKDENCIFQYALKALVGKIMVTIGLYDLLERDYAAPLKDSATNVQVRYILGGSAEPPQARPELAELYYRIPRLIEFYRMQLKFNEAKSQNVSLIVDPEMKYADFFSLMFDEIDEQVIISGVYSQEEVNKIIAAINIIYDEIKDVKKVIEEIHNEVNRRYGLIKQDEYKRAEKLKQWRRTITLGEYSGYSNNQIDILPEDDAFGGFLSVPSDKYIGSTKQGYEKISINNGKFEVDCKDYILLRNFRDNVTKVFKDLPFDRYTRNIYHNVIDQTRQEMMNAKNESDKLNIASRLITVDRKMTNLDSRKLMMFHETVVYGLNVVNGIYSIIKKFTTFVESIDIDQFIKDVKDKADKATMPSEYLMNDKDFYFGRGGLHPKVTKKVMIDMIDVLGSTVVTPETQAKLSARFRLKISDLLRDILLNVFELSYDFQDLVQVSFTPNDNKIILNFGNLKETVKEILTDVRYYLEIFRGHLPDSVIGEYEHGFPETYTHTGDPEKGTLLFLEQNFLDAWFRNSDQDYEYQTSDRANMKKTLSHYNRILNNTVRFLVDPHPEEENPSKVFEKSKFKLKLTSADTDTDVLDETSVVGFNEYGGINTNKNRYLQDEFGQMVAELLFYNILKENGGMFKGGTNHFKLFSKNGNAYPVEDNLKNTARKNFNTFRSDSKTPRLDVDENLPYLLHKRLVINAKSGSVAEEKIDFVINAKSGSVAEEKIDDVHVLPVDDASHSLRYPYNGLILDTYNIDNTGLATPDSLLFLFNQYVALFAKTFFDKSSLKIYGQLVKSFIAGPLSAHIASAKDNTYVSLYPDMALWQDNTINETKEFGNRADPKEDVILFRSISVILNNIISTRGMDGLMFIIQNSTDVPGYMKDIMKANLPTFIKMFDYVFKISSFIKDFILGMDLNVSRYEYRSFVTRYNLTNVETGMYNFDYRADSMVFKVNHTKAKLYGSGLPYPEKAVKAFIIPDVTDTADMYDSDICKTYFLGFLNNITTAVDSIHKSCREVLRELVDEHHYMELTDGFIANYKSSNGTLPIMPLSSSLYQLRKDKTIDPNRLLPTNVSSGNEFRYYNGTRDVFLYTDKYDVSRYPYVLQLLSAYNNVVGDSDKITEGRYGAFLQRTISMTRYIADTIFFRGQYSIIRKSRQSLLDLELSIEKKLNVYQLQSQKSVSKTLELTDSMDQKRILIEATKEITTIDKDIKHSISSREEERNFNIIDMNIVPFNPSGFMRDIPLTNIYNYAYTLERIVASMFGVDAQAIDGLDLNKDIDQTVKATFVKLIFNPYTKVNNKKYGIDYSYTNRHPDILAPLQRIFRGDNDLNLGTPKFLADQLFNKALFQSLYPRGEGPFDVVGGPIYSLGRLINPKDRDVNESAFQRKMKLLESSFNYSILSYPYRDTNGVFHIQNIMLTNDNLKTLMKAGKERFNTNITRNLFFITNLYRILRLKLNQELVQTRSMIISTDNLVTPAVTEYGVSNKGHTEVFADNEIDSTHTSYPRTRPMYYRKP